MKIDRVARTLLAATTVLATTTVLLVGYVV